MKFWGVITLMFFLNFTALPGIACLVGVKLPQTNVIINEEENHSISFIVYEKTIPKPIDLNDFLKFSESNFYERNPFILVDDSIHLSPYLSIFSPPPEV